MSPIFTILHAPWRCRRNRFDAFMLCAALSFAVASTVGCSDGRPTRVPVAGTVTIDGQPLAKAMLTFYPPSGRPSYAKTDAGGAFRLACFEESDGAQLGAHRVSVTAVEQPDPSTMKWLAPKKYSDPNRSGLRYTIDQATEDLKIELTWNGGKPFVERSGSSE
jgi:hypothetical protein